MLSVANAADSERDGPRAGEGLFYGERLTVSAAAAPLAGTTGCLKTWTDHRWCFAGLERTASLGQGAVLRARRSRRPRCCGLFLAAQTLPDSLLRAVCCCLSGLVHGERPGALRVPDWTGFKTLWASEAGKLACRRFTVAIGGTRGRPVLEYSLNIV